MPHYFSDRAFMLYPIISAYYLKSDAVPFLPNVRIKTKSLVKGLLLNLEVNERFAAYSASPSNKPQIRSL